MIESNRFKGIVFDKDGTLFDFQKTWAPWMAKLLKILCGKNKGCIEKKGYLLGFDFNKGLFLPESLFIAGTPDQFLDELQNLFLEWSEEDLQKVVIETTEVTEQIEVVPLDSVLATLKNDGYVLGLATNDDAKDAKRHLCEKDVQKYFAFLAGFNSGYRAKPDPEMLLAFCHKTKLLPNETVMVGDSTSDLIAGKGAGMFTIGVLSGVAKSDELKQHANLIIKDIGDLRSELEHLNIK